MGADATQRKNAGSFRYPSARVVEGCGATVPHPCRSEDGATVTPSKRWAVPTLRETLDPRGDGEMPT